MIFQVLPALDVASGRLAVFTPEGARPSTAFDGDPVAAARSYAAAGARRVHVVDLDLAFDGAFANLDLIERIRALGLSVQASGGIITLDDAHAALTAGADRVVLGSGALIDPSEAERAVEALGDRALVGIEVEEGRIRPRGRIVGDLPLVETLGWLAASGAAGFLVTEVARVGAMSGPAIDTVRRVMRAGRPVLAAGGVASIDDLRALRRVGAAGAIVGRAALEGGLDLAAAFDAVRV